MAQEYRLLHCEHCAQDQVIQGEEYIGAISCLTFIATVVPVFITGTPVGNVKTDWDIRCTVCQKKIALKDFKKGKLLDENETNVGPPPAYETMSKTREIR